MGFSANQANRPNRSLRSAANYRQALNLARPCVRPPLNGSGPNGRPFAASQSSSPPSIDYGFSEEVGQIPVRESSPHGSPPKRPHLWVGLTLDDGALRDHCWDALSPKLAGPHLTKFATTKTAISTGHYRAESRPRMRLGAGNRFYRAG